MGWVSQSFLLGVLSRKEMCFRPLDLARKLHMLLPADSPTNFLIDFKAVLEKSTQGKERQLQNKRHQKRETLSEFSSANILSQYQEISVYVFVSNQLNVSNKSLLLLFPSLLLSVTFFLPWLTSPILLAPFSPTNYDDSFWNAHSKLALLAFFSPEARTGLPFQWLRLSCVEDTVLLAMQSTASSHNLTPTLVKQNLLCQTGEMIAQIPVLQTLGGSYELQTFLESSI